jgi:DNA segregation ATPase FtsK/SpoIIIE-like protein
MDEVANLADALPTNERRELCRGARMIAAEGREAGVHLALALQDPTHKSLDLRIRCNYLPLSFRVKDGDDSRVILGTGGAEQLPPRQFLTVMDQP